MGKDHGLNSPRHVVAGDTPFHSLSLKMGGDVGENKVFY
jgi:hypothetical protein